MFLEVDKIEGMIISRPQGFKHEVHVTVDTETGFAGLPPEWDEMLKKSGLTKDDVLANPDIAKNAMNFQGEGGLEIQKKKNFFFNLFF